MPRSKEESKKSLPMKCAFTQNLQVKLHESIDVEVLEALHASRNKHRFQASGSKMTKEEQKARKVRDYVFQPQAKAIEDMVVATLKKIETLEDWLTL